MASDTDPIRLTLTMSPTLNAKLEQLAMANCATKSRDIAKGDRALRSCSSRLSEGCASV